MVAVPLTPPIRFVIVGSPAYLARREQPQRPDDLRQHACLRLRRSNGALSPWSLKNGGDAIEIVVAGPLIAHDFSTILGAAIEGVGLAQVPEPLAAESLRTGKLVSVLQQFAPPRELYRNPENVFVAGFIGSPAMNLFTLPIVDSAVSLGDWPIPLPRSIAGAAGGVRVRLRLPCRLAPTPAARPDA